MNDIRTITIDLDDTLWDIMPVIQRAELLLRDWLARYYPRMTERFDSEAILTIRRQVLEEHCDMAHDLTFLRRQVLTRMSDAAGYSDFPVDEAFAVFNEARNQVTLYPEARPALEALGRRHALIAVTNGNADLERIGIRKLFHGVVSSASAGAAKPAREIFDAAVRAGGANAAETLHVGDHPLHDVQGARDAGLRAVWVNRRQESWPDTYAAPDAEVRHVGEVCALVGVRRP